MSGRYRIEKEVLTDPWRNVVVAEDSLRTATGKTGRLPRACATGVAPRELWTWQHGLGGRLQGTTDAVCGARRLRACSGVFGADAKAFRRFAGVSDGWQDLSQHFQLTWEYDRAENGNIALTAEIDLAACNGEFILALGFGAMWAEAGQHALSSLLTSYEAIRQDYAVHWRNWQQTLKKLDAKPRERDLYRASTAVLRTHESKDFLGGVIASLSIPWGFNKVTRTWAATT